MRSLPSITANVEKTMQDIAAGVNTNNLLAAKYGVRPEAVCAQVRRLRKQGLVRATERSHPTLHSLYLTYSLTGASYEVKERHVGNQHNKPVNKYDENMYECLDEFIYPKNFRKHLETVR